MKIIDIKKTNNYLEEYIRLSSLEWGNKKTDDEMKKYIQYKKDIILNTDEFISILGLVDNNVLIGFISLFKHDSNERLDLTPWYSTMYVKKEYRGKGYSKLLNKAILKVSKRLGYNKVYLKTDLSNYYEKFGAKFIGTLKNGEKLYYIDC